MNRRELLTRAGLLAGATALPLSRLTTSEAATGSCYWNVSSTANLDSGYNTYITSLVQKQGRNFAGIRKNYGPDNSPTISPEITYAYQNGRKWTYQNGKPNVISPDTNTSGTFWRSVGNGHYDTVFTRFFNTIKADTRWSSANPFHYSWHHEQYVTSEAPGGKNAGTASDYVAAHRHVYNLLVSSGAHVRGGGNMVLCFVPHWQQLYHDPVYGIGGGTTAVAPYVVSKMDPGPAYYDFCGADIYLTSTQSFTPAKQWAALHKWSLAQGKSFITGETGVSSAKNPPAYLSTLDTLLKGWGAGSGPGQVHALCWTSRVASGGDYRMDASSTILAAYKKLALDPFYSSVV